MKNVNFKKIKELCAKGAILLMLTGTITTVATPNTIYTVSAATKTLKSTKSSALKKLLAAYNSYDKSNYYSTQYKSITKYYNTGVTKINACKTKNDVSKMLDTYKKKMATVKDKKTVLAEYKIKMQKSLLENYKDLVENNNYDSNGLKELESIYNTYNSKINKTTAKTKAKKYKNTAISKMENVCTKVIANADGTKTMSLEQVDKKVKALCKKYPAYTEEEIRTLYVTINMTEFNFDLYEYLEVSSKSELEEKKELIDNFMDKYLDTLSYVSAAARTKNDKWLAYAKIPESETMYLSVLIENELVKKQAQFLEENMIYCAKHDKLSYDYDFPKELTIAAAKLTLWLYGDANLENKNTYAGYYDINDEEMNKRSDNIVLKKYANTLMLYSTALVVSEAVYFIPSDIAKQAKNVEVALENRMRDNLEKANQELLNLFNSRNKVLSK